MNIQDSPPRDDGPLILPFSALDRTALALVGGKAANLGELVGAKLPVPPGVCITTRAYALATEQAGFDAILTTHLDIGSSPEQLARAARTCLLSSPIPPVVASAIADAYQQLGAGQTIPVAVRSSATSEDLPDASFAGQQESYLNVVGIEAILDAVRRCWASLWTERAISYRNHFGIDHRTTRLAIILQQMIDASVAGVIFTANPLTGKRRQAVIEANPGLGEAVVSGATNPDHLVVNTPTGEIIERHPGEKRVVIRAVTGGGTQKIENESRSGLCLSEPQIHALVKLGAQVEAHYGAPQDIEWALDASGRFWLTQARPITTLYPLPVNAPQADDILRVYFSVNVLQGVYRPLTPLGLSAFRLFGTAIATKIGMPPRDPLRGPSGLVTAGLRLFLDLTPVLRHALGRRWAIEALGRFVEARSAEIFKQVVADPRLSITSRSRRPIIRIAYALLIRNRLLPYLLQALLRPSAAQERVVQLEQQFRVLGALPHGAAPTLHLTTYRRLMLNEAVPLVISVIPAFACGLASLGLVHILLKSLVTSEESQILLRGLPANPTIEMDLELWALAQQVRADAAATQYVLETLPTQMAQDYHADKLPPTLQHGLQLFLARYGHRAIAEIDPGLPRWSENPTHLLGMLANYLQLQDPTLAPDRQFRRSQQEAEAIATTLIQRAARKNWWRGLLVKFFLKRVRTLAGLRERPKYYAILVLAKARNLLLPVGEALVKNGRLSIADDIFFLTLQEAEEALAGADMHGTVNERRTEYERELQRHHIPRVLLSDGTEPVVAVSPTEGGQGGREQLKGSPASPGIITGRARVILDPTGARLSPGEILIAPSTDPGWTPLFLTAGGLVMEMGGAMSHGAVVAREYGIPAVVGVPDATQRITSGQHITVDGSNGTITLSHEDEN
ncbi:MAG: phosphoenolpyruvate synthase [Ktedonobacteraceae bacterium]